MGSEEKADVVLVLRYSVSTIGTVIGLPPCDLLSDEGCNDSMYEFIKLNKRIICRTELSQFIGAYGMITSQKLLNCLTYMGTELEGATDAPYRKVKVAKKQCAVPVSLSCCLGANAFDTAFVIATNAGMRSYDSNHERELITTPTCFL